MAGVDEVMAVYREMVEGHTVMSLPTDTAFYAFHVPEHVEKQDDRYFVGMCECRMCEYRELTLWPECTIEANTMECDYCGHPTLEPIADNVTRIEITDDET